MTDTTNAHELAVRDMASAIALRAEAIASGKLTGPTHAAAKLILSNAETLVAWTSEEHTR